MRVHTLANEVVYLDLSLAEHLALAHAVYDVMAAIEPRDVNEVLGSSVSEAYEFAYSLYVIEISGRRAGVPWLQDEGCVDCAMVQGVETVAAVLDVTFSDEGSIWRLNETQLLFIERVIDARVHRSFRAVG